MSYKKCHERCPGGEVCCCNGGIHHELHVCQRPDCECHSRERYADAKQMRELQRRWGKAEASN